MVAALRGLGRSPRAIASMAVRLCRVNGVADSRTSLPREVERLASARGYTRRHVHTVGGTWRWGAGGARDRDGSCLMDAMAS